jgi:transcriptional regulator with XRE-family HTH domain
MKETDLSRETFGEYLRRLRESRNLSLRQAAKEAGISSPYLSQIEGGKRGKRKTGEDHFGPHPQFLKKLADVYHVSARQLFERAGYLEDDKFNISGFSEEREIERIFDFVIHDPALKNIFTVLDKRALVNRYEALTGKRLMTWAGEPDAPSVDKPEYAGLVSSGGSLYAETPHKYLTLEEVAQELDLTPAEVKTMVEHQWLEPRYRRLGAERRESGEWIFDKHALREFKQGALYEGIMMRFYTHFSKKPNSQGEYQRTLERIEKEKPIGLPIKPGVINITTSDLVESEERNRLREKLKIGEQGKPKAK